MKPYLIMTGVEIQEKHFSLPETKEIMGVPRSVGGYLNMTLAIQVQGSGDFSKYVRMDKSLDESRILMDVINGVLKINTVNEL